jgi:hypothetical protein
MPVILNALLEIVKITIPALVVFWTIKTIMTEYLERQYRVRQLELNKDQRQVTLPLRLQAYERLSLFCDRITIPNLILRLRTKEMTNAELRMAMVLTVQQEYEHNVAQQIYVSDELWRIIQFSRDEAIRIVTGIAETVQPNENSKALADALFKYIDESDVNIAAKTQSAIRKEIQLLF